MHTIDDSDIDTKSTDLFRRGTRHTGQAPIDTNGLPQERHDQTGNALALEDGKFTAAFDPTRNGAEVDPLAEAIRDANAAKLQAYREIIGFLTLGKSDFERIGWLAAGFCHWLFPGESQRAMAKRLGKSVGVINEKMNTAKQELAAFLRANTTPTPKKSEHAV